MKPPNIPDLILRQLDEVHTVDDVGDVLAFGVKDGILTGHANVNRKLSWIHLPVWVIAETLDICKKYPKSVIVKKRFKEHKPHKPIFEMATLLANMYLDYINESMRFVQCTFPGDGTTHVTLTVHGGGLHRLMFDTEADHPWVVFLFELMLKDNWLDECAKMRAYGGAVDDGVAGKKRPIVTVYRDISNGYIHAGSKWSYTYG